MSFYESSLNVDLDSDKKTLRADCKDSAGRYHPSSIDISQYLGNHDGSFAWHGSDFVHSARNIRLDASMLCAELQSNEGEWVAGTIDLNTCIANVEGKLAHADKVGGH
ncbi:Cyanovirin-N [Athelia psychrophila]|uniref:Cyanovirin-N n=1 Tax=Athelia psychrophila TaxID=1759441 RepID=A0A166TN85_9AGAM|nr:Cyanovirin-N [Fibularhizoctonia sp. CBS 109695]